MDILFRPSHGGDFTLRLDSVPRVGEIVAAGDDEYRVTKVIYEIVDFKANNPEHPHSCKVWVDLDKEGEDEPVNIELPEAVKKPRQERG